MSQEPNRLPIRRIVIRGLVEREPMLVAAELEFPLRSSGDLFFIIRIEPEEEAGAKRQARLLRPIRITKSVLKVSLLPLLILFFLEREVCALLSAWFLLVNLWALLHERLRADPLGERSDQTRKAPSESEIREPGMISPGPAFRRNDMIDETDQNPSRGRRNASPARVIRRFLRRARNDK